MLGRASAARPRTKVHEHLTIVGTKDTLAGEDWENGAQNGERCASEADLLEQGSEAVAQEGRASLCSPLLRT